MSERALFFIFAFSGTAAAAQAAGMLAQFAPKKDRRLMDGLNNLRFYATCILAILNNVRFSDA